MAETITRAQRAALSKAANRERSNLCPVVTHRGRVHAAAGQAVIDALDRKGLIIWDGLAPRISDAGRALVES